jgi:hypothetical protein
VQSARNLLHEVRQVVAAENELVGTGYIRDVQKEFTEGSITLALITG